MTKWVIREEGGALWLHRPHAPRMDFFAVSEFPEASRHILAHEIRKDLWRELQNLRGFSPVVKIKRHAKGLTVQAGGQVSGRSWPKALAEAQITALLTDPTKRARWIAHAARKQVS
ncbi:MAG: hypothetical protein ACPGNV_05975 [Mangrovicoccus sp.]